MRPRDDRWLELVRSDTRLADGVWDGACSVEDKPHWGDQMAMLVASARGPAAAEEHAAESIVITRMQDELRGDGGAVITQLEPHRHLRGSTVRRAAVAKVAAVLAMLALGAATATGATSGVVSLVRGWVDNVTPSADQAPSHETPFPDDGQADPDVRVPDAHRMTGQGSEDGPATTARGDVPRGRSSMAPGHRDGTVPSRDGVPPGHRDPVPGQSAEPSGAADSSAPGKSDDPPRKSGQTPGHRDDPPGKSDDPPGQSGQTPGHRDDPPGKSDDPPGQSGQTPGHGDSPPGHTAAPGQGGSPPGHGGNSSGQADSPQGQFSAGGPSADPPGRSAAPTHSGARPGQGAQTTGHRAAPPEAGPPPGRVLVLPEAIGHAWGHDGELSGLAIALEATAG